MEKFGIKHGHLAFALAVKREELRKYREYAKCDKLHKRIRDMGYIAYDSPEGPMIYQNK